MNWNDLSVLVEVARSKSMSGAAKRLGVSQTTVSRRIQALETALDVKLVRRRSDGISLTEEGVDAARSAEAMGTTAHDLERRLLGRASELAGRLRVTTHPMLATYQPTLFADFATRYPRVELEVEADRASRSLARREADLALRMGGAPDEGLFGRKLATVEYAPYASTDLVAKLGEDTPLSSYPWLAFTERMHAKLIERWMRRHLRSPTVACRYEDSLSLHAAVRAGCGVGFIPCAFADPDPGLVRVRGVQPGFGVDIWCLTHRDLTETSRVRAFLTHAAEYFDAREELWSGGHAQTERQLGG